ncbi:hypothetical protein K1719_032382 [Acacia pycnantha]|nr:hypothetical protein K1719_032382 [Acacia pycnantha]
MSKLSLLCPSLSFAPSSTISAKLLSPSPLLQENSKYLNWKEQDPKFLSLMEKCFKDVVATGYAVFMPHEHILSPEKTIKDEPINDSDHALEDEGVGEGNTEEHPMDHNHRPSVRNNDPRKRKRGRKGEKRQGIADKLQHSLDRILENIDQMSQTTGPTSSANDHFSMSRCLLLLKDVPGLVKGSPKYMLASRIFIKKQNREAFIHYMENEPELALSYLSMFEVKDVKNYR